MISEVLNYSVSDVFGYPVFTDDLSRIEMRSKQLISTINSHSFVVSENDAHFKKSLICSEVLLPDGVGIVAAARLMNGMKIKKIAGADLHDHLLKKLNRQQGRCFYLGSSPATLQKIKARLSREYPDIQAQFYSPPYKPAFSLEENLEMVSRINAFEPDVVFVGMTAPKQEKWAFDHKDVLQVRLICSIGAVFDFYAGTVDRPSKIWVDWGLEWFIRLIKEPRRMWRRYLYNGPIFFYLLLKKKFEANF